MCAVYFKINFLPITLQDCRYISIEKNTLIWNVEIKQKQKITHSEYYKALVDEKNNQLFLSIAVYDL